MTDLYTQKLIEVAPNLLKFHDERIHPNSNLFDQEPFIAGIAEAIVTPMTSPEAEGQTVAQVINGIFENLPEGTRHKTIIQKTVGLRYLETPPGASDVCRILLTTASRNYDFLERDPRYDRISAQQIRLDLEEPGRKAEEYSRQRLELIAFRATKTRKPGIEKLEDLLDPHTPEIMSILLNRIDAQGLPYWMNYLYELIHGSNAQQRIYFSDGVRNPNVSSSFNLLTYMGWAFKEASRVYDSERINLDM